MRNLHAGQEGTVRTWHGTTVIVMMKSLSRVWLFATQWTVAHQAPPSMGFSRQEYWSGLPFPWNNGLVQNWERINQGCMLLPCAFNIYAEYIMWNTRLVESQAAIKTARRNINNLRYADHTTLMAKSEEELKSLLLKVKVESKKGSLKTQYSKN